MSISETLVRKYPLISEQVTKADVQTVLDSLENVLEQHIPGAVVEFGCYVGTTSLFIRRLLDTYGDAREFHVYDSFEGLPAKGEEDKSPLGTNFRAGELRASKQAFIQAFQRAHLQLPTIHKTWFSALTADDVPSPIAFAFLDGDFYESIRQSLQLVLPRMSRGGVIAVHDYQREALPGVTKAVEAFNRKVTRVGNLGIITC